MDMARLDGKTIIILGASDGRSMGAATARVLAREGANLVLAARRKAGVDAVASEVGGIAVACDITDEAQIEALAAAAVDRFGGLDGAINYAGADTQASILDVTVEQLRLMCDVHFIGTALFLKHMARRMERGGSLVTTSSLTAVVAPPGLSAYAGTKRGVDHMVRVAANELGERGIRVNSVIPGFTRSAMTEDYFALPTLEGAFLREIPLGRLSTVDDVANAALWLLSDESASTTGQAIDCTAGQSLRRTPTNEELMR
jgi:NAD(P)-dependent dehydrogenase (short-subunit alcohol dehydrogenase family)